MQGWDRLGIVVAIAQLVVGAGLLALAALVPAAVGLHDVGMLLVGGAIGGAVLPGVRRPGGAGAGPVAGAGLVLLTLLLAGCGGAGTVAAVGTVDVACEELEQQIEARHAAGESTPDEASAQISCARQVCDAVIERLEVPE